MELDSKVGKKFKIFVKPLDEDGFEIESAFGWLSFQDNLPIIIQSFSDAFVFTEKEEGHGSYSDWKKYFEEDYPSWKFTPSPTYID